MGAVRFNCGIEGGGTARAGVRFRITRIRARRLMHLRTAWVPNCTRAARGAWVMHLRTPTAVPESRAPERRSTRARAPGQA